ncbi:MAG: phosphatidylcholine/phosphatidylserine synthase [Alphaproteobacteria bacterium]
MLGGRRRRLRALPVNSIVPNVLTVMALCAGMTAIRFALLERFDLAVAAILVAAILDGLDGRMARLLKGATRFGAELDSLSDFIAFGVAPAMMIYLWSANELGGLGWMAALAHATCCALRLARFNVALDDPDKPAWTNRYFTGLAAPAGAGCALLPLIIALQFDGAHPWPAIVDAAWLFFIAFLMVSQIPTYSLKVLRVKREHVLPVLVAAGFVTALLVSYPWFLLSLVVAGYMASIPLSIRSQRKLIRATTAQDDAADNDGGGAAPSEAQRD